MFCRMKRLSQTRKAKRDRLKYDYTKYNTEFYKQGKLKKTKYD